MKKIIKGLLTVAVFVSSLFFFGNKAEYTTSNKQFVSNKSQNLILQHAKNMFSNLDTPSALAWHESHSSHWSHGSHDSHSSHYSHYSSSY